MLFLFVTLHSHKRIMLESPDTLFLKDRLRRTNKADLRLIVRLSILGLDIQ